MTTPGLDAAERKELELLRNVAELLELWRTDSLPGIDPVYRNLAQWRNEFRSRPIMPPRRNDVAAAE